MARFIWNGVKPGCVKSSFFSFAGSSSSFLLKKGNHCQKHPPIRILSCISMIFRHKSSWFNSNGKVHPINAFMYCITIYFPKQDTTEWRVALQKSFSSSGPFCNLKPWLDSMGFVWKYMSEMAMDQYLERPFVRGMNIHKSQLFWCELQGYKVAWPLPKASCIRHVELWAAAPSATPFWGDLLWKLFIAGQQNIRSLSHSWVLQVMFTRDS